MFGTPATGSSTTNSSSTRYDGLYTLGRSLSTSLFPRNADEAFLWAGYLATRCGLYAETIRRAVRYFLRDIEVIPDTSLTADDRQQTRDSVKSRYSLLDQEALLGDDLIFLGNSYSTVYFPVIRLLQCPKCGMKRLLRDMYPGQCVWKNYSFHGRCPASKIVHHKGKSGQKVEEVVKCDFSGEFEIVEFMNPSADVKPRIIRWPPQFMKTEWNFFSGRSVYWFDIAQWSDLISSINSGSLLQLEDTPLGVFDALRSKQKLMMNPEMMYHMKTEPIAQSLPDYKGLGYPRFLSDFDTVVELLMMDRYDEALIMEYLMPFRLISPGTPNHGATRGTLDVITNVAGGDFREKILSMLELHRRNPTGWNVAPYPVNYQVLGGEAANMVLTDRKEHLERRLIKSIGVPEEFSDSSADFATTQMLRFLMFEGSWSFFTHNMNGFLEWLGDMHSRVYKTKKAEIRNVSISVLSDDLLKSKLVELMQLGQLSRSTGLSVLGQNANYERKMLAEEAKVEQEEYDKQMQDAEKDQTAAAALRTPPPGEAQLIEEENAAAQQQQQMGGAPMPGAPPVQGGGMGAPATANAGTAPGALGELPPHATIDQLEAHAQQIAQQLYTDPQRQSQLVQLSYTQPEVHAVVTRILQQMDTQAEAQGRMMGQQGQLQM